MGGKPRKKMSMCNWAEEAWDSVTVPMLSLCIISLREKYDPWDRGMWKVSINTWLIGLKVSTHNALVLLYLLSFLGCM